MRPGYIIVFILVIFPTIYLSIFNAFSFSNFSASMLSIGKILGLSGMVLFSLVLLLNTRLRMTEKLFYGLDKTYRVHHAAGLIAFLLILFHPLFLASQFIAVSTAAALKFLYPFSSFYIATGSLALLSMIIFLILTFFAKLKYQNWKFTHKFLGFSFILASIHVLLVPSDVSRYLPIRIYVILFMIIGISSFLYRGIFPRYFVRVYDYRIKSLKRLDSINEITLEPKNKILNFTPGQFIFISFDSNEVTKEYHPFTISSSSANKELVFSIKNLGDFTGSLEKLKEGESVKIEGPFGRFSFVNYPSKNYVFIAGGIGITPLLSMLRSISDNPNNYQFGSIDLYYSVKTEKEAVFLEELKRISERDKRINIFPYISEKSGYLNFDYINKNSKNLKNSEIFICGPPAMMTSFKKQFISSGIKRENIHMEEFAII